MTVNELSQVFTGTYWATFAAAIVMAIVGGGIYLLLGTKYKEKGTGYELLPATWNEGEYYRHTKDEYDWIYRGFWIMYFFLVLTLGALGISQVTPISGVNTFILRTDTQLPFGFTQCTQGWADQGVCALWSVWIIYIGVIAFYSVLTAFFWDISAVWLSAFLILNTTEVMGLALAASLGNQMTRIACYIFSGVALIGVLLVGAFRIYVVFSKKKRVQFMNVDPGTNQKGYGAAVVTTVVFNMIAAIYFYIDFILSPAEVGEYNIENQAIGRLIVNVVCYMAVPLAMAIMWAYRPAPTLDGPRTVSTGRRISRQ